MYFDHIYSVILEELKILDFIGNYFLIIKILNLGGQNRKKINDKMSLERSILHRLVFIDGVLLQNWIF